MDREQPLDVMTFRRLMSRFATGVTVLAVKSLTDGSVIGMTANAIASVSLEPMLLLVCVDRGANIVPAILDANSFSVSMLGEDQVALSDYFAGRWRDPAPQFEFATGEFAPFLTASIGVIECRRSEVLDGGDHWIVLGEIATIHAETLSPSPLLFFASQYTRLE